MERATPPADISPSDFFTRWVPEAVEGDLERQRKLGDTQATIVFDLAGAEGGVYTLHIDQGRIEGSAGGDPRGADLCVRIDVPTWRRLNAGEISAPEAMLRRRVKLDGDFLLGLKLHLILG